MKIADMNDLKLEQWIRQRNSAQIMWKTKDGREKYRLRICQILI